jgi:hypothetical protein
VSLLPKLLLLFAAHALCDYPLQGDFLARGKNHRASLPGVPWYQCLGAHALIHAGAVYLITGSIWIGIAELMIHAATDYAKCDGRITFNQDQSIHYACKVVWALL